MEKKLILEGTVYASLPVNSGISRRTGEEWKNKTIVVDDGHTQPFNRYSITLRKNLCNIEIPLDVRVRVECRAWARDFTSQGNNGMAKMNYVQELEAQCLTFIDDNGDPCSDAYELEK